MCVCTHAFTHTLEGQGEGCEGSFPLKESSLLGRMREDEREERK